MAAAAACDTVTKTESCVTTSIKEADCRQRRSNGNCVGALAETAIKDVLTTEAKTSTTTTTNGAADGGEGTLEHVVVVDAAAAAADDGGGGCLSLPWIYTSSLLFLTLAGKTGDALGPVWVETRPLLLLALNSNDLHLALSVPATPALPWYIIGTLRRLAEDPVFYLIGWHYGDTGLRWLQRRFPGMAGGLEKATTAFRRFSSLAVVIEPGAIVCLLAGSSRMQPTFFLFLNLGGTVARLLLLRCLAASMPKPLDWLLALVRQFSLPLLFILGSVALFSGFSLLRGGSSGASGGGGGGGGNNNNTNNEEEGCGDGSGQ